MIRRKWRTLETYGLPRTVSLLDLLELWYLMRGGGAMVMDVGGKSRCRTCRDVGPVTMLDQHGAIGDPGLCRSVPGSRLRSPPGTPTPVMLFSQAGNLSATAYLPWLWACNTADPGTR
jgi:hypothetical protein